MNLAAEELFAESDFKHKPWAYNGKALRVGEIILIIDADTIVPEVSLASLSSRLHIPTLISIDR